MPCIRWEFGFTCPFCLLHEVDFAPDGCAKLALMTIEHIATQSQSPARRTQYRNCVLACRLCNSTRSARPSRKGGRKLLNPRVEAWAAHFVVQGDALQPTTADASYTAEAYGINRPIARLRRRIRATRIEDALQCLKRRQRQLHLLETTRDRATADKRPLDVAAMEEALQLCKDDLAWCRDQLARYAPIPCDADRPSRCNDPKADRLPAWLSTQLESV